tara:strand:- start:9770 stop:9931 length:162 start_codon:yes stop_codon:yes gene_type:complete
MTNKEKQKSKKIKFAESMIANEDSSLEEWKKNLEKKIEEDFGKEMLKKITILT